MNTFRYILAIVIVVGLPPSLAWWFVVHPFVGFWRKRGVWVTMIVMAVLFTVTAAGLWTIRDSLLGADLGLQWSRVILGTVFVVVSAIIGSKRKKHLTMRILTGLPEVQTEVDKRGKLLVEGIYSKFRHPRYVEFAAGTIGFAAIANYRGSWIVAILCLPVLHLIVLLEERELADRFGDEYRDYAARVPRYLPKKWR